MNETKGEEDKVRGKIKNRYQYIQCELVPLNICEMSRVIEYGLRHAGNLRQIS